MLLDFHLAREPIRPGGPVPESFGGTPPYMPPEQRAAVQAIQSGRPVQAGVDRRADVYALGAILYESLGGELPSAQSLAPPLADLNPNVSAGLSDVVARCMSLSPSDRYATAADLADDLRRHLTDQPLAGVANRSVVERWHKWRRRRPGRLRYAGALMTAAAAVGVLAVGAWLTVRDGEMRAAQALGDGDRQLVARDFAEARHSFERGLALAERLPLDRTLERRLRDQLATARQLDIAEQLHHLADQVRVLYVAESLKPDRFRPLISQCDAIWRQREAMAGTIHDPQVSADLQDIAIFAANLQHKLADHASALRLLDEAEAMFGPSVALILQRRACGVTDERELPPVRTAWEHVVLGRSHLASGNLALAARELNLAVELDPAGRWPNFYHGLCAYRTGRYDDAVAAFSVCIGISPREPGVFYNRALAYSKSGQPDKAARDVARTLQLDPANAPARELSDILKMNGYYR
jgi:tetratricopeptide (TPR) repeat protein